MSGQDWSLVSAVVALVALTVLVGRLAGLRRQRDVLIAAGRAVVQLAAVGLVIGVIFRTPFLAPVYLLVVLVAAAWTSSRRLRVEHGFRIAAVTIAGSAASSGLVVLGTGALPWEARSLVPFLVQLMGGAMSVTSLAGQRLIDDVHADWAEVEGWLALGAGPSRAVADLGRRAAARALVPAIDQTRNVGLVMLPGAYVGLLLAGASPWQAGRVQLLVLIGLLAAETVAAVMVTWILSGRLGARRPADPEL